MSKRKILEAWLRCCDRLHVLVTAELVGETTEPSPPFPRGTLRELSDDLSRFVEKCRTVEGPEWHEARMLAIEVQGALLGLRTAREAVTWEGMQGRLSGYLPRCRRLRLWLEALPEALEPEEAESAEPRRPERPRKGAKAKGGKKPGLKPRYDAGADLKILEAWESTELNMREFVRSRELARVIIQDGRKVKVPIWPPDTDDLDGPDREDRAVKALKAALKAGSRERDRRNE